MLKRFQTAWLVLVGKLKLEGGALACASRHLAGEDEAVKRSLAKELRRANEELKRAHGFIAALEKWDTYRRMIADSQGKD